IVAGTDAAARAAQHVDDLPELRAVAAHDGGRERRLWTETAQAGSRRHRTQARRNPGHHAFARPRRSLSGRAVRRTATARAARPRAHGGAGNAAPRRAAVEP